jgi:hypothetical protein
MPYSSISEVPYYVPQEKRKQWLDVWNSEYEKHGDESRAFASANSVTGTKSKEKFMRIEFRKFIPLVKVDLEKREIHGIMAEEVEDKAGETFDYLTSKPYIRKWSEGIEKASDGKSLGNVRVMHGSVAAGKVVALEFDDVNKKIPVVVKVVDDNEWAKVQEGVYTGFSLGGRYVRKWTDGDTTRYTASTAELSIVDNPCMYGATFTAIKADGSEEMRKFVGMKKAAKTKTVSGEELHASDFAHVGDPEDTSTWKLPIHDASHVRNALARFNQTQGMSEEEKKAAKAKIDAKAKSFGVEVSSEKVAKSLWDVGRMADLLQTIYTVQTCLESEAECEGDGSDIPARLKEWLTEGVSILTDLAEEEGQELISKKEGDESMTPEQTALLEKATGLIDRVDKLEKMSAEHKAHLGAVLEHHASMGKHLAAMHDGGDGKDGAGKVAKDAAAASAAAAAATPTPNAEVEALKTEVADLTKNFKEFLEELGKSIPKKSDLPAGAVAKSAAGTAEKGKEGAAAEEAPREVITSGGNKVDLAKFGRDTLAKPLYVNPTIAR